LPHIDKVIISFEKKIIKNCGQRLKNSSLLESLMHIRYWIFDRNIWVKHIRAFTWFVFKTNYSGKPLLKAGFFCAPEFIIEFYIFSNWFPFKTLISMKEYIEETKTIKKNI